MSTRPNILWYCTDQQRFDTIGALNNPHVQTPRLDSFMREAVTFTHTYCQSPVCTPSRASFLTGMYPSALHVNGNGSADFPVALEDHLVTNRLAREGYDCGLIGKLHIASAYNGIENRVDDGYRTFHYSHGNRKDGHDYFDWIRQQGENPEVHLKNRTENPLVNAAGIPKQLQKAGLYLPTEESDNVPPHLHQSFWCTEMAVDFLEANESNEQPWLLSINPFDPHPPFDPPWEYYRRYDPESLPGAHFKDSDIAQQKKLANAGVDFQSETQHPEEFGHQAMQAAYYAMITQLDHQFGRLLDHLEEIGQRDNTIIIFTSDHGEALGDHGLSQKGCRFYEGSVRVPLMISWPGHFREGITSDALVELTDLTPTFYDLLNIEPPYDVQGKSLLPVLTGKSVEHRDFVRSEFLGALALPDQTHATMYRDRKWKLITYHAKNMFELFDLESDPWEHNDLSGDPNYQAIKWDLVRRSFDATIDALPRSTPRVGPY
jgi:arylsulfatase